MSKDAHLFPRTAASISIIKNEILKIQKVLGIVIQAFTMAFYGIMVYVNHTILFRVIAYSLLLTLSISLFILGFLLNAKEGESKESTLSKDRRKRKITLYLKGGNYLVRLALIGFAIYSIVKGPANDLMIIATIGSAIIFLAGMIMDIIGLLLLRYIEMLSFSIKRDIEENKFFDAANKVSHPIKIVEAFTDKLAGNEKPKKELNPKQQALEDKLLQQRKRDFDKEQEKKKSKKMAEKQEHEVSKARIKENLKKIFSGKKNGNNNE